MAGNPPAMQETQVPILGSGRSPGEGNGSPHQYCWLENPTDRGSGRPMGVAKESDTMLVE